jgi:hypothetical protein
VGDQGRGDQGRGDPVKSTTIAAADATVSVSSSEHDEAGESSYMFAVQSLVVCTSTPPCSQLPARRFPGVRRATQAK